MYKGIKIVFTAFLLLSLVYNRAPRDDVFLLDEGQSLLILYIIYVSWRCQLTQIPLAPRRGTNLDEI